MSRDQSLMYRACRAVMSGTCPTSVSKSALDGVSHARWLTLAIRILVLYMTFAIPPFPLQRLAYFIIFCYAPQWFAFRVGWRATDAPRVFFQGMKQMLKLLPEEQAKVLPVLEHNAYWLHPKTCCFQCCLMTTKPFERMPSIVFKI